MSFDIVGDIHGHADRLESLLSKMGYRHQAGAWRHPTRSAIFVGDLIDRGPGQIRTLEIVRDMIDAGAARAIMGNHEFNAIAWATPDPDSEGEFLRARGGEKGGNNHHQHKAFLDEVGADSALHREWVDWFLQMPLWIETPALRVVHACWSPDHVDALSPRLATGCLLTPDLMIESSRKGSSAHDAVEVLLKGPEVRLPAGVSFKDHGGHVRHEMRLAWWRHAAQTLRDGYIGPPGVKVPDEPLPASSRLPEPDRPTFFGHYWFREGVNPIAPVGRRSACVDFSVAGDGLMAAYRFDGEDELSAGKFVLC